MSTYKTRLEKGKCDDIKYYNDKHVYENMIKTGTFCHEDNYNALGL